MKSIKRLIGFMISAAMIFSLAACGQQANTPSQNEGTQDTAGSTESPAETTAVSGAGGNVLVVYYSATGSTGTVAGYIANALGADTFEITPQNPYTSDDLNWNDQSSRVSREHDDPALRDMALTSTAVDNWDSYDTVFVGYPIWWGIAAWPVDAFISANDFTGKTVIPFSTSLSSGMGESGELLAELAGTGDWQEGLRFRSSVDENDVIEWVDSLGLSQ